MPSTSNFSIPYPSDSDAVDVPGDLQALAEASDTAIDGVRDRVAHAIAAMDVTIGSLFISPLSDSAGGGAGTVTFPAGRFSVAPICTVSMVYVNADPQSGYARVNLSAPTTSSVALFIMNGGPGAGKSGSATLTSVRVQMTAVQMTSGSGTG